MALNFCSRAEPAQDLGQVVFGGADRVFAGLEGPRSRPWRVVAAAAELLVLREIMMAFAIAFATPTVGLAAGSPVHLLTALTSSVAWVVQVCYKKTPTGRRSCRTPSTA